MKTFSSTVTPSNTTHSHRSMFWTGRILLVIFLLFMGLDIAMHFANPPQVIAAFAHLGFPDSLSPVIAILSLLSVGLYLVPRTAVIGAVLETGYLGGAVAIHVRVGDATFFFPVVVATVMWVSIYCRDARVRALFSFKNHQPK